MMTSGVSGENSDGGSDDEREGSLVGGACVFCHLFCLRCFFFNFLNCFILTEFDKSDFDVVLLIIHYFAYSVAYTFVYISRKYK